MDTHDPIEELLQELRKHLTVNPEVRIVFDRDEEVLSAVLEEIQEIADLVYASDDDPRFKIGTDELLGDLLIDGYFDMRKYEQGKIESLLKCNIMAYRRDYWI